MSTPQLIFGIGSWLLNAAFLLVVSAFLYVPLKTRRPSLNVVLFIFMWIFVTSAFVLFLGMAGLLTSAWFGTIGLVGFLVILLVPATRRGLIGMNSEISQLGQALTHLWHSLPRWLQLITLFFIGFNLIRFAFLIWALPPFVWDSLTYHLTNVAHWVQSGKIELFSTPVVRIYTPANFEVLASWFAVFLHHDAFIEAAGLPAYVLALSAIYAGIRGLGLERTAAWMGLLAYGSAPGFLIAITGTKNDPHMAAYYLTVLTLIIHLVYRRKLSGQRKFLGPLVALGLVLLLAAGTKAYIAHLIPGLALAGILLFSISRPRIHLGGLLSKVRSEWRANSRTIQIVILILLLIGLFLGGFWNIRNWILKGNPFYPYGVEIEGNQILPEGDRTARFDDYRLRENFRLLAERFWDRQDPIRPDLTNTTGWGWFAYGLGLPTALWALLRRRRFWALGIGFMLSFVLLMFSTRPSPWNMRYAIWFPAVFSYSFALFVDAVQEPNWAKYLMNTLFVGCLGISLASTITYNIISVEKFDLMLERPLWERHASILKLNMPAEYEHALVFVPEGEPLGYNVGVNGFVYPYYQADFSQELVYVPFDLDDSCQEIASRMKRLGVRYLAVAPEHTQDEKVQRLRECGDNQTEIRERARGLYVLREE